MYKRQEESLRAFREKNEALRKAGTGAQSYAATMIPAVVSISYVNYALVAVLGGIMALKLSLIHIFFYVVVGLALAVAGGTLLERLHMEKHVEQFVFSAGSIDIESPELTRRERVRYAREQAVSLSLIHI